MIGRSCPNCTVTLTENLRFCPNCGHVLSQTGGTIAPTQSSPQSSPTEMAPPQLYSEQPLAPQQTYPQQTVQQSHAPLQPIDPVVNENSQMMKQVQPTSVVPAAQKNVLLALLLTFLFGPLGLLYVDVKAALIFFGVTVVLSLFTAGVFVFLAWVISMVWSAVAVSNYNKGISAV